MKWQHHPNGNYYLDYIPSNGSYKKNALHCSMFKIERDLYGIIIEMIVGYKKYKYGYLAMDSGLNKAKKYALRKLKCHIKDMEFYLD